MRNKGPLCKKRVLSVRITDSEMGQIQELMDASRLSASELLREALEAYAAQWSGRAGGRSAAARAA